MRIEMPHQLGQTEAIARLDRFVTDLMARQWPGGVVVGNARKAWSGPRMTFAFDAGKGGFGVSIDGTLVVEPGHVSLEADLPMIVRALIGEDRVRDVVAGSLRDALEPDRPQD